MGEEVCSPRRSAAPPPGERSRTVDVLIVSLGATGGLRTADEELLGSLRRAGADAAIARAEPPRAVRTLMLTDLLWALAARRAALAELRRTSVRALVYSSTTAALLWPRPGAIRFDALAAGNRPGRHGLWQRPLERRRLHEAPLLLPWSDGALAELPGRSSAMRTPAPIPAHPSALTLPVPIEPSPVEPSPSSVEPSPIESSPSPTELSPSPVEPSPHPAGPSKGASGRDIAAFAYVANPAKKGLERILEAWRSARKPGEELILAGAPEGELRARGYTLPAEGVRVLPMLPYAEYRALLRRTRAFVCAARREDYGIAQLEALADGCMLVTTLSPGPYVALPIARHLDPRLVGEDLAGSLRTALDEPAPGYAARASLALEPFRRTQLDRIVAEELLPALMA
jgi:glycosyltransferase involved in cell wall biosynthesis